MRGIDPLEIEVAVISGADDSHHFLIGLNLLVTSLKRSIFKSEEDFLI